MSRSICLSLLGVLILNPLARAAGPLTVEILPSQSGRNLLANSSFEELGPDGMPTGWAWQPGPTESSLTVIEPGHDSGHAVSLTNRTPLSPHVYARLVCGDVAVRPGQPYTVSADVRTTAGSGTAWVGGGQGWFWRLAIPNTNGEWRRISKTFMNQEATSAPFMFLSESPTTPIDVDNVQLEEGALSTGYENAEAQQPKIQVNAVPRSAASARQGLYGATWAPELYPSDRWLFGDGRLYLAGYAAVPTNAGQTRLEIDLQAGDKTVATYRGQPGLAASNVVKASLDLGDTPPPSVIVLSRLVEGGQVVAEQRLDLRVVTPAEVRALVAEARRLVPALRARGDDEARLVATTTEWFAGYCEDDLRDGLVDRAFDAASRLTPMILKAQAAAPRPLSPRYQTGPLTIVDGAFVGSLKAGDQPAFQAPVYLCGFGHFGAVRQMVDQFPGIGANLIQIEVGPAVTLPAEDRIDLAPLEAVRAVLDRAAAAGVMVNVLLSPHYFPQWAKDKWPELANFSGGFLNFDIHNPHAKAVIERFLRLAVPQLAGHPALHSFCLSNEPLCLDQAGSPEAQRQWRDWLRREYGSAQSVNQRWGSDYTSLGQIPIPPAQMEASARCVDYVRFNQESFAGWHRWMADVIHSMAPEVPVHAKIMISAHFSPQMHGFWSVAPELFADLSQINGNDAYKWDGGSQGWAANWLGENMGYDYQRSAKLIPVFNSENHFITDRDLRHIRPEFVYNVLWQGAVHGQGASTAWVWERTTDPASDFAGSIMHRPDATAAYGQATLDLNRVSREMANLSAAPAKVAIVWSQATAIWRGQHAVEVNRVYEAANFLDRQIGFINERDADAYAAGQANRAFDSAKLVLAPGLTHCRPSLLAALARFEQRGGKVLWLGDLPAKDDAGADLEAQPAREVFEPQPLSLSAEQLLDRLREPVGAACGAPAVPVGVWGAEARSTVFEGRRLVNLCNYTNGPLTVTLPAARCLPTGVETTGAVTLAPLECSLYELR